MKEERQFRVSKVTPFLKTLKHTAYFPIQQLTIVGDADVLLCMYGRFVALELKAKGQVPRPIQKKKLDWVAEAHGVSIVATPDNWEQVKSLLLLLDQGESYGNTEVFEDFELSICPSCAKNRIHPHPWPKSESDS